MRWFSPLLTQVSDADRHRAAGTALTLLAFAGVALVDMVGCSFRGETARVAISGGGAAGLLTSVATLRWHGNYRRVLMVGFGVIYVTVVLMYCVGGLPGAVWAVAIIPLGLALFFREKQVLVFSMTCALTAGALPLWISHGIDVPPGGGRYLYALFMFAIAVACTTAGWQARFFTSETRLQDLRTKWQLSKRTENLEEVNARLRFLAERDSLTGVYNRRHFDSELDQRLASLKQSGQTGALLVLDLDGFKEINDTYGHQMGDRVVVTIAEQLRGSVRDTDLVGRLGGDEFAVFVHGSRGTVGTAALRIARGVQRVEVLLTGGPQIALSSSVGVAVFPDDGRGRDDLLRIADEAMYVAKRSGDGRPVFSAGARRCFFRGAPGPTIS